MVVVMSVFNKARSTRADCGERGAFFSRDFNQGSRHQSVESLTGMVDHSMVY